jgi:hypothetical protein
MKPVVRTVLVNSLIAFGVFTLAQMAGDYAKASAIRKKQSSTAKS